MNSELFPYDIEQAFSYYPSSEEVDHWCSALLDKSLNISVHATFVDSNPITPSFGNNPNTLENRYLRFDTSSGHVFYAYWQPAHKSPAPLLVNLPGYGSYIGLHPQIVDDGYNILHISPLGYVSPEGIDNSRLMEDGNWPVLVNQAKGMTGNYSDWLLDALLSIRTVAAFPEVLNDRISLFGTSQGGGGSLLLASLLQEQIRCVCADLPFLTAFPLSGLQGSAYGSLSQAYKDTPAPTFWNNLGYVDTLSHAHRLHIPVMLSAGGKDDVCPAATVEKLYAALKTTKQFTFLENGVHTHSRESMYLFRTWFSLFA